MNEKRTQNRQKLQTLLRELFQFDAADLDFGIYHILNQKRDDIERFIEQDLLDAVAAGLAQYQQRDREELEARLAELRQQLGTAIDASGDVKEEFRQLPIAQEYTKQHRALQQLDMATETEARIFNDLVTFFSRYYDSGDFLSKRRYSTQGPKYIVPYNGEEVLLHWANRDQYYVKSSERFADYRFTAVDVTIWFRLSQAQTPQNNNKGESRYFMIRPENPVSYDAETGTLTVHFEYRPLTEEEGSRLLAIYNAAQSKSNRRKTLDRSVLCFALEQLVLDAVVDATLKAQLAAVPAGRTHSLLGRHLNRYTARNTMDYFVHKDLGGFLRQELDFFLKNEVLRADDVIGDQSAETLQLALSRMRVVRFIGEKIIDFLAQIEDFQKRLFEKKKFVVQTDYCLTLDRVPDAFYPEIVANQAQLDAWRELYRLDKWPEDLFWRGEIDAAFLQHHPYLMVDTAFFDADFKARLLATFDDLDAATDGLLLHSENFQALNLLQTKHGGQVKCIYIDPPYNTGNDAFIYKDNFRHSSWLAMMENRLSVGHYLLTEDGVIFVSLDDNEQAQLKQLGDSLFGKENFVTNVIWQKVYAPKNSARYFSEDHDYLLTYAKNKGIWRPNLLPRSEEAVARYINPDDDPRGPWKPSDLLARNPYSKGQYEIVGPTGKRFQNPTGTYWRVSKEKFQELDSDRRIWWGEDGNNVPALKRFLSEVREGVVPQTLWTYEEVGHTQDAKRQLLAFVTFERNEDVLNTVKPIGLVRRILQISTLPDTSEWMVDFFAGSGTTGHAVINLNREDGGNRKYILVEVGDYFNTMLKPRLQRVAFSANWKDGVPQDKDGLSHLFKYQRLESYEDALNNIRVQQPEGPQRRLLYDEFDDYQIHYMLDFETQGSPSLLTQDAFEKPFAYQLLIQRGHETPQIETVDLIETFHYLIGLHVHRQERHEHQARHYHVSRGQVMTPTGIENVVVIWRDTEELDLEQEADWANEAMLTEPADRVYVNGPSYINNAEPLEITFRDRMEGGVRGQ